MATAKFNEKGELVNSETGEVIGNVSHGPIRWDSGGSEVRSLEEMGVNLPEMPPEEPEADGPGTDMSSPRSVMVDGSRSVLVHPPKDAGAGRPGKPGDSGRTGQRGGSPGSDPGAPSRPAGSQDGPALVRDRTKYEVSRDSTFTVRFGLLPKEGGRFMPIREDAVEQFREAEAHWVRFRMWSYREELAWKSECLEYNTVTKSQSVNQDMLNERKIRSLMLDWSFGEHEPSLRLLHCDGRLSDESYEVFMGLYPAIAKTIVDMMNYVLESSQ